MERTIIVSIGDYSMEIPYEDSEDKSEVELYEDAADYIMSMINIEIIWNFLKFLV